MGGGTTQQTQQEETRQVDPAVSNFFQQHVFPNFGQPGFSVPQVPGNFPIGFGPHPMQQWAAGAGQGIFNNFTMPGLQGLFGGAQSMINNPFLGPGGALFGQGSNAVSGLMNIGLDPRLNPNLNFNLGVADAGQSALQDILTGNFGGLFGGSGGGMSNASMVVDGGTIGHGNDIDADELAARVTGDIQETFLSETLPQITSQIHGSGNTGSSRDAILSAQALEDSQDAVGDAVAAIRMDAAGRNQANQTQRDIASLNARGANAAVSSNSQQAMQAQQLDAMMRAIGMAQGGLQNSFGQGLDTLFNGANFGAGALNSGFNVMNMGMGQGLDALLAPFNPLSGLGQQGMMMGNQLDNIIQRGLGIWQGNNSTGLQTLQQWIPFLNPFMGAGSSSGTSSTTTRNQLGATDIIGAAVGLMSMNLGGGG